MNPDARDVRALDCYHVHALRPLRKSMLNHSGSSSQNPYCKVPTVQAMVTASYYQGINKGLYRLLINDLLRSIQRLLTMALHHLHTETSELAFPPFPTRLSSTSRPSGCLNLTIDYNNHDFCRFLL